MSDLKTYTENSLPIPGRAFVRCQTMGDGVAKVFGGFVLAGPFEPEPDAIYTVSITLVEKLAEGRGATGQRLDQVMTGEMMGRPEMLEHDPFPIPQPPAPQPPKLSAAMRTLLDGIQETVRNAGQEASHQVKGATLLTAKRLRKLGLVTIQKTGVTYSDRGPRPPIKHFAWLTDKGLVT